MRFLDAPCMLTISLMQPVGAGIVVENVSFFISQPEVDNNPDHGALIAAKIEQEREANQRAGGAA